MTEAEQERMQEVVGWLEHAESDLLFLDELKDGAGEDKTDDVREVGYAVSDALHVLREMLKLPASDAGVRDEDEGPIEQEAPPAP